MQGGITIAMEVHFKYYEDDFTVGYYDIFDDWYGWHKFYPTYYPQGGYFWPSGTQQQTEANTTANYTFY
jgi:hypothetical protein